MQKSVNRIVVYLVLLPLASVLFGCGSDSSKAVVTSDAGQDAYPVTDGGDCSVPLAALPPSTCAATAAEQSANLVCGAGLAAKIYQNACEQRQQFIWNMGVFVKSCYYDNGLLVGARLSNDIPNYCFNTADVIQYGVVDPCPSTAWQLVLDCNKTAHAGM